MGTYPPRECGIATFNQDLLNSSQQFLGESVSCKVVAINLPLDTYIYPPEVEWQLNQDSNIEYENFAKECNIDPLITGIMVQHEYGIYGGVDGENILSFIENCKKPIVVTLHTVLPNPTPNMKAVTKKIIKHANIVVVLTKSSKVILEKLYPKSVNKVQVIPHGIHSTSFSGTLEARKKLKLKNVTVLSTFGLLSRGKGIEYVIKALPKVIKKHPMILYLILGETHPVVRKNEGENYRNELIELVTKLHLDDHVRFYNQYLSLNDLIEFLKATDIYISTSINPDQAVSGTLSYALGTGRTTISTEFAQAKEIITKETGRLVPIKDPYAFSKSLIELLDNKTRLKRMHKNAYLLTRPMLWSNVAQEYSKLLRQNILPPINLSHLIRMTDKFGMFQFAILAEPNKDFGYTLDDNARALVVCTRLSTELNLKKITSLICTYVHFIEACQLSDGSFVNYIEHSGKTPTNQNKTEDLEDSTSRAIWALSELLSNRSIDTRIRKLAKKIFVRALPITKQLLHLRASALTIKAFSLFQNIYPKYRKELTKSIRKNAEFLIFQLGKNSIRKWHWFDTYLGYNNGIIPEALFIAGLATGNKMYINQAEISLSFLIEKTFSSNRYIPIGHSEWYKRNGTRSNFDQQPEDPASMILALVTAYEISHNKHYKDLINTCFSWFLGNNTLQLPLYNYKDGGCFDGLHPDRVNLNQGAESLVSYLLSRQSMTKVYNHENSSN